MKTCMKTCIDCKETKEENSFHMRTRRGRYAHCKKCHHERQRLSRRRQKATLVAELGGKCIRCGYNKCFDALEFHHRDPSTKSFGLAAIYRIGFNKAKEEAKKCDLLCANCHREVEQIC